MNHDLLSGTSEGKNSPRMSKIDHTHHMHNVAGPDYVIISPGFLLEAG